MRQISLYIFLVALLPLNSYATKPLNDGDIRNYIVSGSISNFTELCPCPYSMNKKNQACGNDSEYFRNPGTIKCYPGDVADEEVMQFRRDNNIDAPLLPWNKEKQPGY